MTMRVCIEAVRGIFTRWFHKRNIIIVSEHKVKHLPVSGHLQFVGLLFLLGGVCWASYSTGSFMAARDALKEQGQALRSVTNAHIESGLNTLYKAPGAATDAVVAVGPYKRPSGNVAVNGPIAALSALDKAKMMARITLLEHKVLELRNTNDTIIQRVQDRTAGRLDDLKSIVSKTGLSLDDLKKKYARNTEIKPSPDRGKRRSLEGGPYIPDAPIGLPPQAKEMFSNLDELVMVNEIVSTLPLASPLRRGDMQSGFGHRIDPFTSRLAFHSGLDLAGPSGAKVYSTGDGKVAAAGVNNAYGNAVDIDHGYGIVTRYGHLSEILVKAGDTVEKGDVIGIQGSTGRSTGPHLHYEVRYHDQPMNPKNFLKAGRYVSEE